MACVRGFRDAHARAGIAVDEALVKTCGYAPEKVENALRRLAERASDPPRKRNQIRSELSSRPNRATRPARTRAIAVQSASLAIGLLFCDWDLDEHVRYI